MVWQIPVSAAPIRFGIERPVNRMAVSSSTSSDSD